MNIIGIHRLNMIGGARFSAWRGIKSYVGNPLPSVMISAERESVLTTETIRLTAQQGRASYLEWQTSRDQHTWTAVGDISETYEELVPHEAAALGNHYFRCVAVNIHGEKVSNVVTVTVTPRLPTITVSAYPEIVSIPGQSAVVASMDEYGQSLKWQHSDDGEIYTDIAGETDLTYIADYPDESAAGAHYYRAVAHGIGTAETISAPVTVEARVPNE